jgi:UDP:flavonoid glycosyltransferase YjiC (YdhE family)
VTRTVVTGYGTTGDFVPLLALAEALQDRGHDVLAAVNPWVAPLFRSVGIQVSEVGPWFGPQEAMAHRDLFDTRQRWIAARNVEAANLTDWPAHYRALVRCCRSHGATLLVAGATLEAAPWVAEDLRIPWVRVHCGPPASPAEGVGGVPPLRHPLTLSLAARERTARKDEDPVPNVGFAFPQREPAGWSAPSARLRAFLGPLGAPGSKRPRRWKDGPVVLLPGSTPVPDPVAMLRAHVEAVGAMGRSLVVQQGWAGLTREMLDPAHASCRVHFEAVLPHDWLLRRAAAAIVPGRPGTVARALRAGCPLFLQPRGRDEFANGAWVARNGVGAVLDPRKASAKSIRRMLEERVMLPGVRRRCARMAGRLADQDGGAAAAAAIDSWLEAGPAE